MSSEPVGRVSLDLVIKDTVEKQVARLAGKARGAAKKDFGAVGAEMGASVSKPIQAAQGAIRQSMEHAQQGMKATGRVADTLKAKLDGLKGKQSAPVQEIASQSATAAQKQVRQLGGAIGALKAELDGLKGKQSASLQAAAKQAMPPKRPKQPEEASTTAGVKAAVKESVTAPMQDIVEQTVAAAKQQVREVGGAIDTLKVKLDALKGKRGAPPQISQGRKLGQSQPVEQAEPPAAGIQATVKQTVTGPMQSIASQSVENAKLRVQEVGGALGVLSARLDEMRGKASASLSEFYQDPKQLHSAVENQLGNDKQYQKLLQQNEKAQQKLLAAENKLNLAKEVAAQKTAAKQQAIREKQAVAVQRIQEREKQAQLKAQEQAQRAAEKAEQAQVKAAQRAQQQKQRQLENAMKQRGGMAGKSGKVLTSAVSGLGKKMKGAVSSVGQKVGRMLKTIKTAFNPAILMESLFAAFRGLKETIGGVIGQNERFQMSLNQVKANLSVAFVPVINAVMPALNALMSGLAYASKKLAEFTSAFFGTTYKQSAATMKKVQSVSNAAKKAKKNALASFDQINKLDTGKGESGSEANTGTDYGALDNAQYGNANQLAQEIEETWKALAKRIPEFLAAALTKAAEAAPKMVAVATSVISAFLQSLHAQFPGISAAGIRILQTLMSGMRQLVPDVIPVAVDIITFLIEAFLTYMPSLVAAGAGILAGVLAGFVQKMPELILMAQQAIWTIVMALATHLPQIFQSGMELLVALLQGILQTLPEILPVVQQTIMTLVYTFIEYLPQILDTGVIILLQLISGIIQMIPQLIPAVQQIILQITMAVADHLPEIIRMGVDLIIALIEGILGQLDVIMEQGPQIVGALVSGLIEAVPILISGVGRLVSAIVNKIKSTDWIAVGKSILKGIVDGITRGVNKVKDVLSWENLKAVFTGQKATLEVPALASGGIVSQPTLAMVGDNKRSPEAVAPLHELYAMIDKAVRGAVPAGTQQAQVQQASDKPVKIVLQLGAAEYSRWTADSLGALLGGEHKTVLKS